MNTTPQTILVPFDGSTNAKRALDYAIAVAQRTKDELHVLNVQAPVSGDVSTFVGGTSLKIGRAHV